MGGMDWQDALLPLWERGAHGWLAAICLMAFIMATILILLNLVTGLFVTSTDQNIRKSKDVEMVENINALLMETDEDFNGVITKQEFEHEVQKENKHLRKFFESIDLDISESEILWNLLDIDGSGTIPSDSFMVGCLSLTGNARALELKQLYMLTRQTWRELQNIVQRLDSQSSPEPLTNRSNTYALLVDQVEDVVLPDVTPDKPDKPKVQFQEPRTTPPPLEVQWSEGSDLPGSLMAQ